MSHRFARPTNLLRNLSAAVLIATIAVTTSPSPADDSSHPLEPSEANLAETVEYLASDELQGRGVGTEGIDQAAQFLASQFSELGLKTDLFEGEPYQPFEVSTDTELGSEAKNRLALVGPAAEEGQPTTIELELGEQFNPLAIGGTGEVESEVVFVGYGITAKDEEYDDYEGVDVEGKVALMLRKEPQQENPHSAFNGNDSSRHAFFSTKVANAYEHGAAAVLLVNDLVGVEKASEEAQKQWEEALDELAEKRAKFREQKKPSEAAVQEHDKEMSKLVDRLTRLQERRASDFDEILTVTAAGQESSHPKMPVFFAKRSVVDRVVQSAMGTSLAELEAQIDEELSPQSRALEGWQLRGEAELIRNEATTKNVVAVLEGEGSLSDETVILGAHYDHLGMGGPGSLAPWTREVHNGADDNASGTAVLLEVARLLAAQETKPARRIVFAAFSAEERGLLGSAHYASNPPLPLEKTVAMLNMDMVGRLKDNNLIVYGTGTAAEFDGLIDQLNEQHQFDITRKPGGFGPSDHATFYGKKIPVLHFFTGTHDDYHRPSDVYEKVNLEGMRRITQFVADAVQRIANAEGPPEYQKTKRQARRMGGDGDRPYFGSIPDFAGEAEGYALMGVAEDSPAEQAGLQAGDVIVQFGESRIGGLDDFDSALRKYEAGDEVKTVVLRDDEKVELTVTLAPPR